MLSEAFGACPQHFGAQRPSDLIRVVRAPVRNDVDFIEVPRIVLRQEASHRVLDNALLIIRRDEAKEPNGWGVRRERTSRRAGRAAIPRCRRARP